MTGIPDSSDSLQRLLAFLATLTEGSIQYSLTSVRSDALMVQVAVPGERWEIEFKADGSIEVEVFRSSGEIEDASALQRLLKFGESSRF